MERWFRALAAHAEDLAAVPSTDMVAHNSKPRGRGVRHFLLTSLSTRHAYGVHAYKQAKRSHTQNRVSMKRILTALDTWGDGAVSKELSKQAPGSVQSPASTVIVFQKLAHTRANPVLRRGDKRTPGGQPSLAYLFNEWQAPERHCLKIQGGR